MTARQRIENEVTQSGMEVKSLRYDRPVEFEMGDGEGGWTLETNIRSFNGLKADDVISEMREYLNAFKPSSQTATRRDEPLPFD